MDLLTDAQAAEVVGVDARVAPVHLANLSDALGRRPTRDRWASETVVAMAAIRELDPRGGHPERWADGARTAGDAHGRGLAPAYLVTAGGDDFGVVLDSDHVERDAARAAMHLAEVGRAVRVVRLRPIIEHLCDVLELPAAM
ncbi:MAG: hypothetical protein ABWZ15_00800 [Acidimicrobiia bacterium]